MVDYGIMMRICTNASMRTCMWDTMNLILNILRVEKCLVWIRHDDLIERLYFEKRLLWIVLIGIILRGIIVGPVGQWVWWSCPWSCLDNGSFFLPQLLIGLEPPNRDSKSPNRGWCTKCISMTPNKVHPLTRNLYISTSLCGHHPHQYFPSDQGFP